MPFEHEAFISYSHHDHAWAQKISADLNARHVTTFVDDEAIRAGEPWESKLSDALQASQHLVVLWSQNAKDSDWVIRERSYFDHEIHHAAGKDGPNRRLIMVLLDNTAHAFPSTQHINEIRDAKAYAGGVDHLDAVVWSTAVDRIEQAIKAEANSTLIHLAVLTTTAGVLKEIDPTKCPVFGESLEKILQLMGLGVLKDTVETFYGNERSDWRPFQGADKIDKIMSDLQIEINKLAHHHGHEFRWEPLGDDFWSPDEEAFKQEAAKLSTGPAVVIVDPLSLYDNEVKERLSMLEKQIEKNDQAAVMILATRPAHKASLGVRLVVQSLARRVFDHLYSSTDPSRVIQATCGIDLVDLMDMRSIVLPALRRVLLRELAPDTPEPLNPG